MPAPLAALAALAPGASPSTSPLPTGPDLPVPSQGIEDAALLRLGAANADDTAQMRRAAELVSQIQGLATQLMMEDDIFIPATAKLTSELVERLGFSKMNRQARMPGLQGLPPLPTTLATAL